MPTSVPIPITIPMQMLAPTRRLRSLLVVPVAVGVVGVVAHLGGLPGVEVLGVAEAHYCLVGVVRLV
ncbi:hypothetical protein BJX76DRAFT_315486 [Aspergillus varians]